MEVRVFSTAPAAIEHRMPILRTLNQIPAIDIQWTGPYSVEEVVHSNNTNKDYGLYQIYGTHPLFGPDTLLYIGRATETGNKFGGRLRQHDWISYEPRKVSIYLGYLGSTSPIPETKSAQEEWGKWIEVAESILIYFCRPPRNSHGIKTCPTEPVILFNVGERHHLPTTLSNLYLQSPALVDPSFQIFVEPDAISP